MPKKGKVGFISTVKPFYDNSKLTARILLAKDLREQSFLLVGIYLPLITDKSRQYLQMPKAFAEKICYPENLSVGASDSLFKVNP